MNVNFLLAVDAEPTEQGFVALVRITTGRRDVFSWRCPVTFPDEERAVRFGRDYAEVALSALQAVSGDKHR